MLMLDGRRVTITSHEDDNHKLKSVAKQIRLQDTTEVDIHNNKVLINKAQILDAASGYAELKHFPRLLDHHTLDSQNVVIAQEIFYNPTLHRALKEKG